MEADAKLTEDGLLARRELSSRTIRDARSVWFVRIGKGFIFSLLTILAVTMLLPYFFALSAAFKTESEFLLNIYRPWPEQWVFENFQESVDPFRGRMGFYVRNSAVYAVATLAVQLFINAFAAFAFARLSFPGRDVLFIMVLATMMLPFSVMLIPVYLLVHWMGLAGQTYGALGNMLGVVLPSFASGFGIFMLRQFFLNQSAELEEAALIDGAGWFRVFWTIALPLARPALIALGIFIIVSEWSSFIWPLIVLDNWDLFPITVGLSMYKDLQYDNWTGTFAASVVGTAPLVIIFLILQRHIVGGIQLTGIKG